MNRRNWLQRSLAAATALAVSGCDRLAQSDRVNSTLDWGESWTRGVQRVLLGRSALAPEYSEQDISREFRANGSTHPDSDAYNAHLQNGFATWKLVVDGLIERPLQLSLNELRQ